MLEAGIKGHKELTVTEDKTAKGQAGGKCLQENSCHYRFHGRGQIGRAHV